MARLVLVHARPGDAGTALALLRKAGHVVHVRPPEGGEALRELVAPGPDAIVLDLDRGPARARAIGTWLRQRKASRDVPLVFAGGDDAAVAATRRLLPDATFTAWSRIRGAVREALATRRARPVVPGTMAGYSGTPLPRKLGVRADAAVALLGAPRGFEDALAPLPAGVRLRRRSSPPADLVLLFARTRVDLERRFAAAVAAMGPRATLWIAWPKRTSALAADLGQADVRAWGLERGLVDFKICAIDADWSGLRFARRR